MLCRDMGVALLFHYNVGEALGLFAGAQTISAVIGVGQDAIGNMNASAADKTAWSNIIPVCYAVTIYSARSVPHGFSARSVQQCSAV